MSIDVLYSDGNGTAIRRSSVKQYDRIVSFAPVAIKTVVQGTEHYYIDRNLLKAGNQKFIVGNCNTEARILIDSKEDVKGICIDFGKDLIASYLIDSAFTSEVIDAILYEQYLTGELKSHCTNLPQLVQDLMLLLNKDISVGRVEEQLLLILQSYFDIQKFRMDLTRKLEYFRETTKVNSIDFLMNAKEFIETNYQSNINLEMLSNEVGLSKFKLLRDFKSVFGLTPHDYMVKKRLQTAQELLGKMPVQEIACFVGFSDSSSFAKAFKGYFGKSTKHLKL
jgi:AraC-like DNA-binding protein